MLVMPSSYWGCIERVRTQLPLEKLVRLRIVSVRRGCSSLQNTRSHNVNNMKRGVHYKHMGVVEGHSSHVEMVEEGGQVIFRRPQY